MKKTLAIILTVVMLLGLVPMSAFAKEAHNGPATDAFAYISVFYADEGEPDAGPYKQVMITKSTQDVQIVNGVSYNKASNTLTLNNYKNKKAGISVNMMGDDFTINVVGECEIAMIWAWGDGWGGSVTVTGTGTLTVNELGTCRAAVVLNAEHTASNFTVDSGVTVTLYGEEGVFVSSSNLIDDVDDIVTAVSGQELFDIDVEPFVYQNSQLLTVNVITDAEADGYKGNAAVKADDPDTYYGVSIWTNSYGEKEYHVSRYVYSEEYGVYFKDAAFDEEYANEYDEVNFTKEEFEELGFSMTVTGKELSTIFFFDDDAHSGPQLINSADPDGIYMLDHNELSYSDKNDASTYKFKGTIYKLIEGKHGYEADTSFTPIVIGETDYEKLPDGFTAVLDEEYEELYLKGEFEEVSGSLYTKGTENQYVIYNLWSDDVSHHYVYAIEEVSDVPGAYVATLVEDIDDVDNSEYTLVTVPEETDMFTFTTETTEFTFTGDGQSTEPAPSFPDVPKNAWFYDAATYCAENGFITGYKNGNFGPADALQRQDFVVILARIAGADIDSYTSCKLTDVDMNAYYGKAVAWAVDQKIIGGYDNGKFGVGDKITREQVATILYRYMDSPDVDTSVLNKFADKGSISSFAVNAIAWANANGVINGKTATTLAPTATASRAEIATIIMRMDQKGMFA
ncbi:MAG: S-layer homology domain-containing protein [Clostridiaceae bacterium]|nr:S-layer homology domain-containing protein [Clostridiaceae bacterium]